jgi:SET domain-containing protein
MAPKVDHLLDIDFIKQHTNNLQDLKVTLKKDPLKGSSLFAIKPIKKGNVIAYYKIKAYPMEKPGPFKQTYLFGIYKKNGKENEKYIGNLYSGSVQQPFRNIPFWAYFANEPSGKQTSNSHIDVNLEATYKNRSTIKLDDTLIYKLIASRDIKPGEEICWCYGDDYSRKYKPNC